MTYNDYFRSTSSLAGCDPSTYASRLDDPAYAPPAIDPRVSALYDRAWTPSMMKLASSAEHDDSRDAFLTRVEKEGVGVAGAGLMGISIAASFVNAGIPVLSRDVSEDAVASASERLERELAALRVNQGQALAEPEAEAQTRRDLVARYFRASTDVAELAKKPVVVESVPEKAKIKAKTYREIESCATRPLLLLTNTSSLTIGELAATLPAESEGRAVSRERFASFHFFHPATKRRPVEIAVGEATSPETTRRAYLLAKRIGRVPFVVGDSHGFLVNRLLQAYLNEALALVEEGFSADALEAAAIRWGMEAPPLRIVDEIGCDVSLHSGWSFLKAFPERTVPSQLLPDMVREGRLGRKTYRGFYTYASHTPWKNDVSSSPDWEIAKFRDKPFSEGAEPPFERLLLAPLLEAGRLVEERVVGSLRECDAALVLALGFPATRGGLCYWAFSLGLKPLLKRCDELAATEGARFTPPESLRSLANSLPETA